MQAIMFGCTLLLEAAAFGQVASALITPEPGAVSC